jgi:hypothetical protein
MFGDYVRNIISDNLLAMVTMADQVLFFGIVKFIVRTSWVQAFTRALLQVG